MRGKAQHEGHPSITQFSYHVPTSSVTNPITIDTPWCEAAFSATWQLQCCQPGHPVSVCSWQL